MGLACPTTGSRSCRRASAYPYLPVRNGDWLSLRPQAMAGGAITGGLAGLAAGGIGFFSEVAGGALLGGIGYIAAEEF